MLTAFRVTPPHTGITAAVPALPIAGMASAMPTPFARSYDALFAFDASDRAGMSTLDQRRTRSRTACTHSNQSDVIGRITPLGAPVTRERLSAERTKAVRRHIENMTSLVTRVTAEGRGSHQLVFKTCSTAVTVTAMGCKQPNRLRLNEVIGQRRTNSAPR